jgi:hydroxymethylpyrimidine pyrophosphatase-like HAD family hydrolase
MGNAVPGLKEIAKLVIGNTDDDGLAEFLLALIEARKILQAK